MRQILATLIAASYLTETAAWGYGRIAWNNRKLIVPDNHNVRQYIAWWTPKQAKQERLRVRNPWNACWLGAGVSTDWHYVWFNDFCGNNGWLTRCNRGEWGFRNHCYHITRQGGYGGFGMSSWGGNMNSMVWAARHPYGWPSNNYQQTNLHWLVFGNRHMGRYGWWCWIPYGNGADIATLDRWHYGGQMGVLRNLPGNPHAYWMELTLWGNRRSCWHRRNFYQWNVCPNRRRYSQVWGMTYVTGRRRQGWLFFTCKHEMHHVKRRNMYWSHHYRGQFPDTVLRRPTTTTTTTTTIVPITMRTWSFPETLSWKIQENRRRKTVCQGGSFTDWYVAIKYKKCKLKTGWHKIYCTDKVKEGFHGAFVQVKNYKLCKKRFEWGAGKSKVEKFYVRA